MNFVKVDKIQNKFEKKIVIARINLLGQHRNFVETCRFQAQIQTKLWTQT